MSERLSAGLLLGDYEILSVAGAGGMGVVYRARQRSLDRIVALKVIGHDISSSGDYRERFLREARLAASVDHPNVVSVYDVGEQDDRLFLAMQWVDGQDLRTLIDREGALTPERAVALAEQLAGALDAVHDAGLIHRDVKPANVLLREVGDRDHAYLTDFGVAKAPEATTDDLTRTGWVVGTAGYLSPEQIMGRDPDARSDLYAMACLIFELMTGRAPFSGANEMALRWAHANGPRPQASVARPALGTKYDGFFAQALSIDPKDRFQSGRAFVAALHSAHASPGAPVPEATTPPAGHAQTIVEPAGPMPTPAPPPSTPPPLPGVYPAYTCGTPAPAPPTKKRSGSPLALIVLAIVAVAGIAVGALAAGGVFSKGSTPKTTPASTTSATSAPTESSPTTSSETATSRPSPGQAPVEALERYWDDIGSHNYTGAYSYLAPGTSGLSESEFVSGERRAGIQHVEFHGQVAESSGSGGMTVNVVSLVTHDEQFGCRLWSGSYQMTEESGSWRIEKAALTPRSCG